MGIKTWRQKGRKGEYEVRDLLQPIIDRVYDELQVPRQWRTMTMERNLEQSGQDGGEGGSDLKGVDWLGLEVKRQENVSMIGSWWMQCKAACMYRKEKVMDPDVYFKEPVLIYRRNREVWHVRMLGYIPVDKDRFDCPRVRMAIDISYDAFITWFQQRLLYDVRRLRDEFGLLEEKRPAPGDNLVEAGDNLLKRVGMKGKFVGEPPSSLTPSVFPIPPVSNISERFIDSSAPRPWDRHAGSPEPTVGDGGPQDEETDN